MPVLVPGIINPRGLPNGTDTHYLTRRHMQDIVNIPPRTVYALLEHNPSAPIGVWVCFWIGDDDMLWGMVEIQECFPAAFVAVKGIRDGVLRGFSIGTARNDTLSDMVDTIVKVGAPEVSLVTVGARPNTVACCERASGVKEWLAHIDAMVNVVYGATNESKDAPEHVKVFFRENPQVIRILWATMKSVQENT